MNIRPLRADEIDCRISTINEKGLSLLLYKDARVDQNILDETFGMFGWQRSHQLIGDRLYCTVSIKDPATGEWISKQDVGTESYTEKEKGQASDSFKRACFNFGIGRELYTAPFIWVQAWQYKVTEKNGKFMTYDRFEVSDIEIADGKITRLTIINASKDNAVVFQSGAKPTSERGAKATKAKEDKAKEDKLPEPKIKSDGYTVDKTGEKISPKQVLNLRMMCKRHNEMPEEKIYGLYGRSSLEDMTIGDWVAFGKTGERMLKEWDAQHERTA